MTFSFLLPSPGNDTGRSTPEETILYVPPNLPNPVSVVAFSHLVCPDARFPLGRAQVIGEQVPS